MHLYSTNDRTGCFRSDLKYHCIHHNFIKSGAGDHPISWQSRLTYLSSALAHSWRPLASPSWISAVLRTSCRAVITSMAPAPVGTSSLHKQTHKCVTCMQCQNGIQHLKIQQMHLSKEIYILLKFTAYLRW